VEVVRNPEATDLSDVSSLNYFFDIYRIVIVLEEVATLLAGDDV
jgi:hypothetical protein